jgi:glycosyltransferase involved in cell wall biosynthesis
MGNQKIKVCFFSPASYPYFKNIPQTNFGGAEFQMFLLSSEIAKNPEFEIYFLTEKQKQKRTETYENIILVRSITMNHDDGMIAKLIKSLHYFLILIKLKPDVIITTTFNPIVGITAFYKKIFKKKLIHRSANDVDTDMSRIKRSGISGKIFKYGLEHADVVLSQNQYQKKMLAQCHSIKGVEFKNVFSFNNPKIIEKKHVLWVGRTVDFKQPELFIKLAHCLPEIQFVMICPYHKKDFKQWYKLKSEAEKLKNLSFIECVQFNEILSYFNEALVFINTSDYEGFPNTFLQAASTKTPIISLNVNPDNFISAYNCGIFCENNFEKLIQETKALVLNKDDLRIKGENAFNYLSENHNIKKNIKNLEEIIKHLT